MGRPIGKKVEDAIAARLADDALGLNIQLATLAAEYGLEASELQFDFGPDSTQFFVGVDDPSEMAEDEMLSFPNLALVVSRSQNQNLRQGPTGIFSGQVVATLYLQINWPNERVPSMASSRANCYEEALFACFCDFQAGKRFVPGNGLVFARELTIDRGRITAGAENLSQLLKCSMVFEVEAL